jgi:hypothetical protein
MSLRCSKPCGLAAHSLSGGSLERPALQALLAEVPGRRVDTWWSTRSTGA